VIESVGMKTVLVLLLVFVAGILTDRLLVDRPVFAQITNSPGLSIGDIKIAIGMSKEKALTDLAEYNIGPPQANGRSLIVTKNVFSNEVNHFSVLGTIAFKNGAVNELSRNWGNSEHSPEVERLWKSFWGAVTSSLPAGQSYVPMSVRAYSVSSPDFHSDMIDLLVSSSHVVSIQRDEVINSPILSLNQSSGPSWSVSVDETVF
jgi:hypothetical protein